MRTFTEEQAKDNFETIMNEIDVQPVRITCNGKVAAFLMSAADYQEMRLFYAHRASEAFRSTAQRIGLTEEEVRKLIESDD